MNLFQYNVRDRVRARSGSVGGFRKGERNLFLTEREVVRVGRECEGSVGRRRGGGKKM